MSPTSKFFILCDFGKLGRSWIERDDASCDWQSTIADVASGEVSNMVEIRRAEDWADVTEEAVKAVTDHWANTDAERTYDRMVWIELHIGTRAARCFLRAQ